MSQGKLVRDKIPQVIRSEGLEPVIYTASSEEYATRRFSIMLECRRHHVQLRGSYLRLKVA